MKNMRSFIFISLIILFTLSGCTRRRKNSDIIEQSKVPTNLEECFIELDKVVSDEVYNAILKMRNEDDVIILHRNLGMWIRNNWIRQDNSPIRQWFYNKGIKHPDTISNVILRCYWRYLHYKAPNLDYQIERIQKREDEFQDNLKDESISNRENNILINKMMLNVDYMESVVSHIELPEKKYFLDNRKFFKYNDNIICLIKKYLKNSKGNFEPVLKPYFLNLKTKYIHEILIQNEDIMSCVVVDNELYIISRNNKKYSLYKINNEKVTKLKLPKNSYCQLGNSESNIITVYHDKVYILDNENWKKIVDGDRDTFIFSSIPPYYNNNCIYFRAYIEDRDFRVLNWYDVNNKKIVHFKDDIGITPVGHFPENISLDYLILNNKTKIISYGGLGFHNSLFVKKHNQEYKAITFKGETRFIEITTPLKENNIEILGVTNYKKDIYGIGTTGLYKINDNKINKLLTFSNISQTVGRKRFNWRPSKIKFLNDTDFIASGLFGGIFLFQEENEAYSVFNIDEEENIGEPLVYIHE